MPKRRKTTTTLLPDSDDDTAPFSVGFGLPWFRLEFFSGKSAKRGRPYRPEIIEVVNTPQVRRDGNQEVIVRRGWGILSPIEYMTKDSAKRIVARQRARTRKAKR